MASKPVHSFRRSPPPQVMQNFVEAQDLAPASSPVLSSVPDMPEPGETPVQTLAVAAAAEPPSMPPPASPMALVADAPPPSREEPARVVAPVAETVPAPVAKTKVPRAPRATATTQGNGPRESIDRTDGRHLSKVSVYLDVGLAKKLRVQSASEDIDMSVIVGAALEAYFSK